MQVVRLIARGLLNSFRDPTAHKYQRTLPLPPVTTVRGLLAAAMDLPPEQADELPIEVAVARLRQETELFPSDQPGRAIDLWKYRKYKGGEFETSSILQRELLYRHDFEIYYRPTGNELTGTTIAQVLSDPAWALALGREDELIRIGSVEIVELREAEVQEFRDMLVPADMRRDGQLSESLQPGRHYVPPLVLTLPTRFIYDSKGVRTPAGRRVFSFLDRTAFSLKEPQSGAVDEERQRHILFA